MCMKHPYKAHISSKNSTHGSSSMWIRIFAYDRHDATRSLLARHPGYEVKSLMYDHVVELEDLPFVIPELAVKKDITPEYQYDDRTDVNISLSALERK